MGYNLITSPLGDHLFFGDDLAKNISDKSRHIISAGFGYRNEIFFIDLAYRQQLNHDISYLPYDDYYNIDDDYMEAPLISETMRPWKLLLTVGFKF